LFYGLQNENGVCLPGCLPGGLFWRDFEALKIQKIAAVQAQVQF
jgi:hypothetical protein